MVTVKVVGVFVRFRARSLVGAQTLSHEKFDFQTNTHVHQSRDRFGATAFTRWRHLGSCTGRARLALIAAINPAK
jgi:hypothetical protein